MPGVSTPNPYVVQESTIYINVAFTILDFHHELISALLFYKSSCSLKVILLSMYTQNYNYALNLSNFKGLLLEIRCNSNIVIVEVIDSLFAKYPPLIKVEKIPFYPDSISFF